MEDGFIISTSGEGLARAGDAWWKLELQRELDLRERQDSVEMCI